MNAFNESLVGRFVSFFFAEKNYREESNMELIVDRFNRGLPQAIISASDREIKNLRNRGFWVVVLETRGRLKKVLVKW